MTHAIRSTLVLATLAVVLVACGTTAGAPASGEPSPTQPATPSLQPSGDPSEPPVAEERQVDGTITVYPGAVSGPGGSIADAIADGPDDADMPSLVNGVLFRDTDGTVYLATSVGDASVPTFDGPMLEVLNTEIAGYSWDMADAEMLGLEEANGIVFKQDAQVLGTIELP
jgi:hypothetical protein